MQWNEKKNFGFSDAEPWLPVADDFEKVNVEAQKEDPTSMLALYERLLELRRGSSALGVGKYASLDGVPEGCFAYAREDGEEKYLVLLNFSDGEIEASLPDGEWEISVSTNLDREKKVDGNVWLGAYEGVVIGAR